MTFPVPGVAPAGCALPTATFPPARDAASPSDHPFSSCISQCGSVSILTRASLPTVCTPRRAPRLRRVREKGSQFLTELPQSCSLAQISPRKLSSLWSSVYLLWKEQAGLIDGETKAQNLLGTLVPQPYLPGGDFGLRLEYLWKQEVNHRVSVQFPQH